MIHCGSWHRAESCESLSFVFLHVAALVNLELSAFHPSPAQEQALGRRTASDCPHHCSLYHRQLIFLFLILLSSISEKESGTLNTKNLVLIPCQPWKGGVRLRCNCFRLPLKALCSNGYEVKEACFQSLAVPIYKNRKLFKVLVIQNQNQWNYVIMLHGKCRRKLISFVITMFKISVGKKTK